MTFKLPILKIREKNRGRILAIDIGKFATKAVFVTSSDGRFSLNGYTILESPANALEYEPQNITDVLKKITEALKIEGGTPTTVCLTHNLTILKTIEMPMLPVVELRKIVKTNPKLYLQQDLADYAFDCHCLPPQTLGQQGPPTAMKQRVIVGGAPTRVVNNIATAIRNAGLTPEGIVPSMIATINALEHSVGQTIAQEVLGVVDLGFESSVICILDHGEPVLSRMVPIGGKQITEELTKVLKIDYNEAEEIKTSTPEAALITLEQVARPLGRELRALIDFFEHQSDRQVTRVYACGGSASSPPILQILEGELFVECKSWNPAEGMDLSLPPEQLARLESALPQLATAIGAALTTL